MNCVYGLDTFNNGPVKCRYIDHRNNDRNQRQRDRLKRPLYYRIYADISRIYEDRAHTKYDREKTD